jgi:hypothetical protein
MTGCVEKPAFAELLDVAAKAGKGVQEEALPAVEFQRLTQLAHGGTNVFHRFYLMPAKVAVRTVKMMLSRLQVAHG